MSKESALGLECPGCNNRIYFTEFHKCSNATGLLNVQVESTELEPKQRKRRRRGKTVDQGNGEDD